jgi:ribonuclease VapC
MTVFLDASVLVSVMVDEDDATHLVEKIGSSNRRITSALALWEATRAVARIKNTSVTDVYGALSGLLRLFEISVVAIDADTGEAAVDAHNRYGKGNHPAKLNMGDCFAYACAKTNNARLLYKGDDFAETDLA